MTTKAMRVKESTLRNVERLRPVLRAALGVGDVSDQDALDAAVRFLGVVVDAGGLTEFENGAFGELTRLHDFKLQAIWTLGQEAEAAEARAQAARLSAVRYRAVLELAGTLFPELAERERRGRAATAKDVENLLEAARVQAEVRSEPMGPCQGEGRGGPYRSR